MFRNLISILLILSVVLLSSNTDAGRKRSAKSGKIKSGVFIDSKYKYQVTIPEGWKGKTKKEKSVCRVDITCEEYKKSDLRTFGADAVAFELLVPMVSIWIVETDLSSREYIKDFLNNPTGTSVNKKILRSMQANWTDMHFMNFQTFSFRQILSEQRKGAQWLGALRSSFRSNGVEGPYPTSVVVDCIQNDNKTIMFIVGRTEPEYFNKQKDVMKNIMRSIKWENHLE